MAFMKHDIIKERFIIIDGPYGGECIPADSLGLPDMEYNGELMLVPDELRDYCENRQVWTIETKVGYGARLSAPGYMDCTEWSVFDTEEEAQAYLDEEYDEE